MSILDALKNLVVKRGGTPKGSNIAEVIDDLAETSSGGGGVNTIDYDSLAETEKVVDFIAFGDIQESQAVFLYDIDLNSQYRFLKQESSPLTLSSYQLIVNMAVSTASECPDTESEDFELAETISGETTGYAMLDTDGMVTYILPTTTQFKTYKKLSKDPK